MRIIIGLGLAMGAVGHIEADGSLLAAGALAAIGIALVFSGTVNKGA